MASSAPGACRAAAWASSGPETGFVELDNAPRIVTSPDGAVRALIASGKVDNEWHITGPDQGTLNGVPFSGVSILLGGADNKDTFILEPGGSICFFAKKPTANTQRHAEIEIVPAAPDSV